MKHFRLAMITTAMVVGLASTGATAQKTDSAKPQAAKVDPLKGLRVNKDEMRDIAFYEHPTSPKYRNSNGVFIYFGKQGKDFQALRFVMQYFADDWLFVEKAWAKADGETIQLPQVTKFNGWERDNGSGDIWEWSDAPVISASEIASIKKLAKAKSVMIRFEGKQYYNDKKLSEAQLKALRDMISAYEAATGRPLQ